MKVVFFGTPPFAAQVLEFLIQKGVEIAAVISKPDKAQGRSSQLVPTPVKLIAQKYNLPLYQPEKVSADEFADVLPKYHADLFVVVAYGEIIKQHMLDIPRLACINVHASLLPKYRGAAPIQRAIIDGETETGITIMHMVRKMDAGDIIKQTKVPISANETYGELEAKLCEAACPLLLEVIHDFDRDIEQRTIQDESLVTYAPKIEAETSLIDWSKSAQEIHNLIRGLIPFPEALCYVELKGEKKRLKILSAQPTETESPLGVAQICISKKEGIIIGCGEGALHLNRLKLEGKKEMSSREFVLGLSKESLQFLLS